MVITAQANGYNYLAWGGDGGPGDNLGNHKMIQVLDAQQNAVANSSGIAVGVSMSSAGYSTTISTASSWFNFAVSTRGYIVSHGAQPSLSSCGTSTMNDHADNGHGTVSVVGVVTSCTIDFGNPFMNAPSCQVTDNNAGIGAAVTARSNNSITVGFSISLGGGEFSYHCDSND